MFSGLFFSISVRPGFVGLCLHGSWGFCLRATPSGGTRLVVRSRNRSAPRSVARPLGLLLGEPLHFLMQTGQFHNLRKQIKPEP